MSFYEPNSKNAPQEGAIICFSKDIKEGHIYYKEIIAKQKYLPIIATRVKGKIYCYINACPHQFLPLNYRSDHIISSDKNHLLCSVHGAAFNIETGECMSGNIDELEPLITHENDLGYLYISDT